MDYKNKYNDACVRATQRWKCGLMSKESLEYIFPEMKESDDEKIRKELLAWLKSCDGQTLPIDRYNAAIDWLEKQGEQKSTDTDNKFIRMRETKPKDISEFLDRLTTVEQEFLWEHIAKIRELDKDEQKSAWSEEDERLCQCLIKDQEEALDNVRNDKYGHSEIISDLKEMYNERIDWLKSLRPQNRWKPTKEQLVELRHVISGCSFEVSILVELEEQLKKLL